MEGLPLSQATVPPSYEMHRAPATFQTVAPPPQRPVTGRVHIPEEVDPQTPWSRYDLIVAILLKGAVVPRDQEPPVWVMQASAGQGSDSWCHELPVPIDLVWLRAHADLPANITVNEADPRSGLPVPSLGDLFYSVVSRELASSSKWVEAGWVTGEPFTGELPPPTTGAEWRAQRSRLESQVRRAQGKKWWQR